MTILKIEKSGIIKGGRIEYLYEGDTSGMLRIQWAVKVKVKWGFLSKTIKKSGSEGAAARHVKSDTYQQPGSEVTVDGDIHLAVLSTDSNSRSLVSVVAPKYDVDGLVSLNVSDDFVQIEWLDLHGKILGKNVTVKAHKE